MFLFLAAKRSEMNLQYLLIDEFSFLCHKAYVEIILCHRFVNAVLTNSFSLFFWGVGEERKREAMVCTTRNELIILAGQFI